ncbi:MAG: hypothetical protein P1V36_03620 [Planctomycetota bacterium]|nr:hypothetical protein [Planctomycetota bacterium]
MTKLGVILALAALALGGYGLMQLCEKDEQIEGLQASNQELKDRLTTLETHVTAALGTPADPTLRSAEAPVIPLGHASDGTPVGLKGRPTTATDRIASLERRLAAQDETLAKLKADGAKARGGGRQQFNPGNFYGSLDMAAKAMELKDDQKAEMKDLMDRATRELDDLYAIENDEGVTWKEIRKPKMVEGNGFSIAMPDMAKIAKFKKGRIPGSSETFGEAEQRIRKDAFGRMRNVLTPAQTKKWDKAHKDGLLRGRGGGMVSAVSFVGLGSDD